MSGRQEIRAQTTRLAWVTRIVYQVRDRLPMSGISTLRKPCDRLQACLKPLCSWIYDTSRRPKLTE